MFLVCFANILGSVFLCSGSEAEDMAGKEEEVQARQSSVESPKEEWESDWIRLGEKKHGQEHTTYGSNDL